MRTRVVFRPIVRGVDFGGFNQQSLWYIDVGSGGENNGWGEEKYWSLKFGSGISPSSVLGLWKKIQFFQSWSLARNQIIISLQESHYSRTPFIWKIPFSNLLTQNILTDIIASHCPYATFMEPCRKMILNRTIRVSNRLIFHVLERKYRALVSH